MEKISANQYFVFGINHLGLLKAKMRYWARTCTKYKGYYILTQFQDFEHTICNPLRLLSL